jgi:uncharacterized protein YndB with AHSA1/START domain
MLRMSKPALTIRFDEFLPHPVPKVWRALTDPDLLARWLMPKDFKLELGHRFTFRTEPMPSVGFDGNIHCEVLAIEPQHMLLLAWRGGAGLDSRLSWRIEPEGDGPDSFSSTLVLIRMIRRSAWHMKACAGGGDRR